MGNGQLSLPEQRSHFALWCLLKSPLLIGTNLSSISTASASILRSPELLAVHQDPLGSAGDLLWKEGNLEVWAAALEVRRADRLQVCVLLVCVQPGCVFDGGVGGGAGGEQQGQRAGMRVVCWPELNTVQLAPACLPFDSPACLPAC